MTDIQTLLADYAGTGSEAAFRELVARHLDLVYSTAVRLLGGDTATAQDVAQTVFVDLARMAKSLSREVRLGGWLHRHTCFVAAKTLRGERRRQSRERQAVAMNALTDHAVARLAEVAPILDEAINQLGTADRAAVLLRYYERLDFRSVGHALGTNEAAAQKRVARALDKLHTLLKRRGATLSVTTLGAALACEAVTAAPAELAANITGAAVTGVAAGTGNTLTLLKFMAATKLKTTVITTVIAAGILLQVLLQTQAHARLRQQVETRQRQSDELTQLTADNQRLASLLARSKQPQPLPDNQLRQILRLRDEVSRLKNNVQEMAAVKTSSKPATPPSQEDQVTALAKLFAARRDSLKQWLEAHPSEKIPELQHLSNSTWLAAVENLSDDLNIDDDFSRAAANLRNNAQLQVLGQLGVALRKYSKDNDGQFPTDLSELNPYLKSPIDDSIMQRYGILAASSLMGELQPGGDWVITQTTAANPALDLRLAYGLTNMASAGEEVTNRWTLLRPPTPTPW